MRFQTARLLLSRRVRRRLVDVTCSGGLCVIMSPERMRCNTEDPSFTHQPSITAKPSHQPTHFPLSTYRPFSCPRRAARGAHLARSLRALIDGVIMPPSRRARVISPPGICNDSPCLFWESRHPFLYFCVRAHYRAEAHHCPLVCLADLE